MKKMTVSIGIPAYNEGANIVHLLSDILRQNSDNIYIKEIIVLSDGSCDDTESLVSKIHDSRVRLISFRSRKGKGYRQNQLIEKSTGDILVILDADISIHDRNFLETLVKPIVDKRCDMTSAIIHEFPPQTFFEEVLAISMKLKHVLFSTIRKGNNVYTCHGPARAFSSSFYKKLKFASSDGEDMYSYFSCISQGFTFIHVPEAVAHYRLPQTFSDHKKQSIRYIKAKELMNKKFGEAFVKKEMRIPFMSYIHAGIKSLPIILTHPFQVLYYLVVLGLVSVLSGQIKKTEELWLVHSSKIVRVS